jgi:hypothetical protein
MYREACWLISRHDHGTVSSTLGDADLVKECAYYSDCVSIDLLILVTEYHMHVLLSLFMNPSALLSWWNWYEDGLYHTQYPL